MTDSTGNVYLVGHRAVHHARHSGYEGFGRYAATALRPPVRFRWFSSRIGWRIDKVLARILRRREYSVGLLLSELAAAVHMLRRRQSLYHVIYGDMDLWLLPTVAPALGNKCVATFHEPVPTLEWLDINRIIRKLDAAILVSESQRRHFLGLLPAERIYIVPHGIDAEFFKPRADDHREPICITVGGHLRDFETFGKAIKLVRSAMPGTRFIAIGARRAGGNHDRLESDDVEYIDDVSDRELRDLYASSLLAIFPFRDTTANNAVLEAMACGLPIVATDVGGIREYVPEAAGLFCTPGDPASMAAAILKLLQDFPRVRTMAKAARARAVEHDYRIAGQKMAAVYDEVMGRNTGPSTTQRTQAKTTIETQTKSNYRNAK